MRAPVVVNGRCIYNPKEFSPKLRYAAIGLGRRVTTSASHINPKRKTHSADAQRLEKAKKEPKS